MPEEEDIGLEDGLAEAKSPDNGAIEGKTVTSIEHQPLEDRKAVEENLFNHSTITIVLQLMPLVKADPLRGRMGLLAIRNDDDVPLFGAPLRGEELVEFLEITSLARLIDQLKSLMPGRLEAQEVKAKEQAVPVAIQPPSVSTVTSSKKGKSHHKSGKVQPEVPTKTAGSSPKATDPTTEVAANPLIPQSVFTPEPAPKAVTATDPVEAGNTPKQLTLF
jgi:hypothetical protein